MKLCRFRSAREAHPATAWGCLLDDEVLELPANPAGWLAGSDPLADLEAVLAGVGLRRHPLAEVRLLAPVGEQEIWAAGVTYERSKQARIEESEFSATAYDRVYSAARPELFFKAFAAKVAGPGAPIGVRADSRWTVPEPELALVLNPRAEVVGCTIGNDVSARDIEGENLLYLPQAKIYRHSCALGPWILLGTPESVVRSWTIALEIHRAGSRVFDGSTPLDRLRRSFAGLAAALFQSQEFPHGAILLTGTGIVPPDDFSLCPGDEVTIRISGIGELTNPVIMV